MARKPHPREDFIADATALVQRVELRRNDHAEPIAAGFRSDGSLSLLFGDDPVYQFNSLGQLRRAFANDRMYKADRGRLVVLARENRGGRVQLTQEALPPADAQQFLVAVAGRLTELAGQIAAGQVQVVAAVPSQADVVARLSDWLAARGGQIEIASSPHAR
jgi:hypothetical protein